MNEGSVTLNIFIDLLLNKRFAIIKNTLPVEKIRNRVEWKHKLVEGSEQCKFPAVKELEHFSIFLNG